MSKSSDGLIERFEEKVGRTGAQSAKLRRFIGIGCEHDHGQKAFARRSAKRFENSKAVDVRHHQIEEDEIGLEGDASFHC